MSNSLIVVLRMLGIFQILTRARDLSAKYLQAVLLRAFGTRHRGVMRSLEQSPDLNFFEHRGRHLAARKVMSFRAEDHADQIECNVQRSLELHGIKHARLESDQFGRRRIAVFADLKRVALVLAETSPVLAAGVRGNSERWVTSLRTLALSLPWIQKDDAIVVVEPVFNGSGFMTAIDAGCEVEFWRSQQADHGRHHEGILPVHGPSSIPAEIVDGSKSVLIEFEEQSWEQDRRHPPFPIDLVYTWVDGADEEWRARRAAFEAESALTDGYGDHRFESFDELRYSLRSVSYYLNFVNHIFIVTDGQRPKWLLGHPQITLVDHTEIFRNPSDLPVFNSHAIEANLHRVPGLSRHYLYLNDDVFIGRPMPWSTFFGPSGAVRFATSRAEVPIRPAKDAPSVDHAGANARRLLAGHFGWAPWNKIKHVPHGQRRDLHQEMESIWPEVYESVSATRFRSSEDVSFAAFMHHYFAMLSGRGEMANFDYDYINLARPDLARRLVRLVDEPRATFCLNDDQMDLQQRIAVKSVLQEFFNRMYPIPAPWEESNSKRIAARTA